MFLQLGLRAFPSTSVVPEVPSKRLVSVRLVEYSGAHIPTRFLGETESDPGTLTTVTLRVAL